MGLIAVVLIVRRHIDVFKKSLGTLSPVFSQINGKVQGLMEKFRSFWSVVSPIVSDIGNMFGSVLTAAIGGMVNFAVSGIDMLLGAVDSLTVVLGGLIDFITGIFTGNWEKAWNGVSTIFTGITDGIKGAFRHDQRRD